MHTTTRILACAVTGAAVAMVCGLLSSARYGHPTATARTAVIGAPESGTDAAAAHPSPAAPATATATSGPPAPGTPGPGTTGPGTTGPGAPETGTPGTGPGGSGPTAGPGLSRLMPGAHLSVVVYDRTTARTVVSERPDAGYTSASVVKLLIAFDSLRSGGSASQVARMLSRSDDGIADTLWVAGGGPAIVTRWAARIGLTGTRPPADPGHWGGTRITAQDVVAIYRYLLGPAGSPLRATVLPALRAATPLGADGFDQYFGIPDGVGTLPWAVKQGWSCCDPGRDLHTTGLIGPADRYLVAVLTTSPASVSYPTAASQLTAVVNRLADTVLRGP